MLGEIIARQRDSE